MSKIKKEEIKMWENILPDLKKNIDHLVKQHREKTIRTYPPDQLEFKLNQIRSIIQTGEIFDEEDYLDVFSFVIEERANISLLQLGDQMASNFGKNHDFWMNKIQHWANLFTLSSSATVWNVTDFMRNYVNYGTSPIQRHNIYQWRLKAQSYLSSIEFLIRKINSRKLAQSSPYTLDDTYMKYYKAKVVYMTFVSTQLRTGNNQDENNFYNDELSITNQGKRKAEMKLFNFSNGNKKIEYFFDDLEKKNNKKSVNTLDKYLGKKANQATEQIDIPNDKEQRIMKQKKLVDILKNVGNNNELQADDLRKQLLHQKYKQGEERNIKQEHQKNEELMRTTKKINMVKRMNEENSETEISQIPEFTVKQRQILDSTEVKQFPISHFTFIFDQRDYFQHVGYRIAKRDIDISNPFILYPWVNYWINDEEEYDDLMAIDLNDDAMDSDSDGSTELGDSDGEEEVDDNIENDENFIDNRKFIVGGYIDGNNLTPEDMIEFKNQIQESDKRWVANFKTQKESQNSVQFLKKDEDSSRKKNIVFQVIPLYRGQLPYPIKVTEDLKTKRRNYNTKSKPNSVNSLQTIPYQMEEIIQNSEEDNSTSNNLDSNSKMQRLNVIESIQEVKFDKEQDGHGEQTTFEEKFEEQSSEVNFTNASNKMEIENPNHNECIRNSFIKSEKKEPSNEEEKDIEI